MSALNLLEETNITQRSEDHLFSLTKNKHILIAVDESDSSKRAVLYVADFLGNSPGFHITIVKFIYILEDIFYETEKEKLEWIEEKRLDASKMLLNYRKILIQAGFSEKNISVKALLKNYNTIAECIIEEQCKVGSCAVVVGRQNISRKEEFLHGSTTNNLLHMQKDCALLIVE